MSDDDVLTDVLRVNSVNRLNKHIKNKKISKDVESSIYNYTLEYCEIKYVPEYLHVSVYEYNIDNVLANLDKKNDIQNDYLLGEIKNKSIDSKLVGYLKPEKLFPSNWAKIIQKLQYKEDKLNNLATTDMFTCSKCKHKRHKIHQQQTRSADEPMTTFVICQVCGYTFKC